MRFQDLPNYIMVAVVIAIIGGAGLLALDAFQDSLTTGTAAYNATDKMVTFISNIFEQLPTAGTMIGIAVLLVVVLGAFYVWGTRRR